MRQVPAFGTALIAAPAFGRYSRPFSHPCNAILVPVSAAAARRQSGSIAPIGGHPPRIVPRPTWRAAIVSPVANPLCQSSFPMALPGPRFGAVAIAVAGAYAQRS
jgi:hypothetical protein